MSLIRFRKFVVVSLLLPALSSAQSQSPALVDDLNDLEFTAAQLNEVCPLKDPSFGQIQKRFIELSNDAGKYRNCVPPSKQVDASANVAQVSSIANLQAASFLPTDAAGKAQAAYDAQVAGALINSSRNLNLFVDGFSQCNNGERHGPVEYARTVVDGINTLSPYLILANSQDRGAKILGLSPPIFAASTSLLSQAVQIMVAILRNRRGIDTKNPATQEAYIRDACRYHLLKRNIRMAKADSLKGFDILKAELEELRKSVELPLPGTPGAKVNLAQERDEIAEEEKQAARYLWPELARLVAQNVPGRRPSLRDCDLVGQIRQSGKAGEFPLSAIERYKRLVPESAITGHYATQLFTIADEIHAASTEALGSCRPLSIEWLGMLKIVMDSNRKALEELAADDTMKPRLKLLAAKEAVVDHYDSTKNPQLHPATTEFELSTALDSLTTARAKLFDKREVTEYWLKGKLEAAYKRFEAFDSRLKDLADPKVESEESRCAGRLAALQGWADARSHLRAIQLFCTVFSAELSLIDKSPVSREICLGAPDRGGSKIPLFQEALDFTKSPEMLRKVRDLYAYMLFGSAPIGEKRPDRAHCKPDPSPDLDVLLWPLLARPANSAAP